MAIEITSKQLDLEELFDELDMDFTLYLKTDKKCPVCGNDFEKVGNGTSYVIKCQTENCIKEGFRGL